MRYLKYTHVDAATSIPVTVAPARNGPMPPDVEGLVFGFALESEYPTQTPTMFGTCPAISDISRPGVLGEMSEPEYTEALNAELIAREQRSTSIDWPALIAARRYEAEIAGIEIAGMHVDTDDRSKLLINGAALEAILDPAYTMQWKTPAGFVELDAAQVLGVARAVRAHVQACFDREAELLAAVADGSITDQMLQQGWP